LSNDRRLWRFFNCDRYSLPILILLYFFSLFSRRCAIFHVTGSISPNWREIRVFIPKKKLALFIVDKNAWRVVASDFIFIFLGGAFSPFCEKLSSKKE
jgi:hypothetical protein